MNLKRWYYILNKMKKGLLLFFYYGFAALLPMQPFPGFLLFYKIRRLLVKKIICKCGNNVIVKNRCYFGDGSRLVVGDRSQLGQNARLLGSIYIGSDVLMGPDVVIMATSHCFDSLALPINQQGSAEEKTVVIGNDVWIGTRVIILPGCKIGDHCIIGAGAIVTKSFPENTILAGNPAKAIRDRVNV